MHPLVVLARESVETFLRNRTVIDPPDALSAEMAQHAGVFVCLKSGGHLRGCIGTFLPCTENVATETIRNAIAAATQDPRFEAVSEQELAGLEYTVDVLSPPERVNDPEDLDPKAYGVIVSRGSQKGLLLPDLDGVSTVEDQLRIARMKAGIGPDAPAEIHRFRVDRYR